MRLLNLPAAMASTMSIMGEKERRRACDTRKAMTREMSAAQIPTWMSSSVRSWMALCTFSMGTASLSTPPPSMAEVA